MGVIPEVEVNPVSHPGVRTPTPRESLSTGGGGVDTWQGEEGDPAAPAQESPGAIKQTSAPEAPWGRRVRVETGPGL